MYGYGTPADRIIGWQYDAIRLCAPHTPAEITRPGWISPEGNAAQPLFATQLDEVGDGTCDVHPPHRIKDTL